MPNFKQLHFDALSQADWFEPSLQLAENAYITSWLLEQKSMTQRLKMHCCSLRVDLINQYVLPNDDLTPQERQLLGNSRSLAREVILLGDDVPWLFARSILPYSTLTGDEQDMAQLGTTPLGQRVFSAKKNRRDEINVANVTVNKSELFARRSRLWINDKPLLVSELFLPDAPIYQQES